MRKKMHSKKWAGLLNKNLSTPAFYKRDFLKKSLSIRDCVNNGFLPNKTTGRSKSIVSHKCCFFCTSMPPPTDVH